MICRADPDSTSAVKIMVTNAQERRRPTAQPWTLRAQQTEWSAMIQTASATEPGTDQIMMCSFKFVKILGLKLPATVQIFSEKNQAQNRLIVSLFLFGSGVPVFRIRIRIGPDSIGQSKAKMTHKNIKKSLEISCLKCWMFSFEG